MAGLRVGLTGGIGAGKSAVARLLARHGAVVVDADAIAREVVAPGTPGLAAVGEEFGREVLSADGSLDRAALGRIVFADPARRERLEAITHPLIGEETGRRFAAARPDDVVVHDVPLLVEKGLAPGYDVVIVVEAPEEVRLRRLVEDRGMSEDDARARIRSQSSTEERRAVADVVVENVGSLAALEARVDAVWADLERRRAAG